MGHLDIGTVRVHNEKLEAQIDGVNQTFFTEFKFVPGTTEFDFNGAEQALDGDYIELGTSGVEFNFRTPRPGQCLRISYDKVI